MTRHQRSPPHRARSPRQSSRQSSCARDIIKTRVDKAKQRLRESVAREIVDKSSSYSDYKTRRSAARDRNSPNRRRNKPVSPIKAPFKSPHKSRTTSSAKSKFQSPKKSKLKTPKKSSLKSPRKSQTNSHHKPQDSKAASSSLLNEASGAYEEDSISDLYELKQSLLRQLSSSDTDDNQALAAAVNEHSTAALTSHSVQKINPDNLSSAVAVVDVAACAASVDYSSDSAASNDSCRLQIDLTAAGSSPSSATEDTVYTPSSLDMLTLTQPVNPPSSDLVSKSMPATHNLDCDSSAHKTAYSSDTCDIGKENKGGDPNARSDDREDILDNTLTAEDGNMTLSVEIGEQQFVSTGNEDLVVKGELLRSRC